MSEAAPAPVKTPETSTEADDSDLYALADAVGVLKSTKTTADSTPATPAPRWGSATISAPRASELVRGTAVESLDDSDEALAALVDKAIADERKGARTIVEVVSRIKPVAGSREKPNEGDKVTPEIIDTAAARVMVGKTVEDLVTDSVGEDSATVAGAVGEVIAAGEAAGALARTGEAINSTGKEPLSEVEKDLYKKMIFVIQKRIMSELDPKEVAEVFENGGADAYFKLLHERFAANEGLQIIAEWLNGGKSREDEPAPVDPSTPVVTPPSTPVARAPRTRRSPTSSRAPRTRATAPDPTAEFEAAAKYAEGLERGEKLLQDLDKARQEFARLTVEQRARGWSRSGLHEEFNAAEEAYNRLSLQISTEAVKYLRELDPPLSEGEIRARVCGGIVEEKALLDRMRYRVVEGSSNKKIREPYKKFCSWWEKQKGAKGFVTKSLVGIGFGIPAGIFATGAAGLLGIGGIGAFGAIASTRVARGAMISKISARGSDKHIANDKQDTTKLMNQTMAELDGVAIDDLANYAVNTQTQANRQRINIDQQTNRRRVRQSVAATAIGAVVGSVAGDKLGDWLHHRNGGSTDIPSSSGGTPEVPGTPNTYGFDPNVVIEQGHGYTHELQELVATKGINLNGNESYQLYDYLENLHGGNLLDKIGSYNMGGDYGINSPGNASWKPEVLKDVNEWLRINGKAA